jgi:hypothetical protein
MANTAFVTFNQTKLDLLSGVHNLSTDTFKWVALKSLANGGIDPTADLADPRFGVGGTTDLSTSEVTAGGNYPAGGITLTTTLTESTGTVTFDAGDISILVDASNPTDVAHGVIINTTAAGNRVLGYHSFAADRNLTTGALNLTIPSIFTLA